MKISLKTRLSLLHFLLLVTLLSLFSYGIFVDTKKFLIQNNAVRLRAQAKPVIDNWLNENKKSDGYLPE
ncbi:MAG: sensor histidine kinase, partial [Spirochaetes bacterium]